MTNFDITNRTGEVIFRADQELYTRIVTDILTVGNYVHTFNIFEGKLTATFKTISAPERIELFNKVKDIENGYEADMIMLTHYLDRIKWNGADIQIAGTDDGENKLRLLPELVMNKIIQYYGVFLSLTNNAFEQDDVVKNL